MNTKQSKSISQSLCHLNHGKYKWVFLFKGGKRCLYLFQIYTLKFWNQPSISDALRLRKVCDSTCFYSVNTFELYKEGKRVGDSLMMKRSDLVEEGWKEMFLWTLLWLLLRSTFRDGLTPQVVQQLLTDSSWLTAPFGMTWSSELPHPRSSNNWSIADLYRM